MNNPRFHLLGPAHIATHRQNSFCPFTQKILKLATILKRYGHTVFFYGVEGSDVDCDEFIQVCSEKVLRQAYGKFDAAKELFKYSPKDLAYQTFNRNTVKAINERRQEKDILLCPMGVFQQQVAEAVGLMAVESGVGYPGVFAKYKVFDSYAWMHYTYGKLGQEDGGWYDAVIPNYFDPAEFPFHLEKEDFLLYMGRIISRKGVSVASDVAKATGNLLYVVGQGSLDNPAEGLALGSEKHIRYLPAVGPEERAELMGKAKTVLMPTYYLEPFGMVAVEAQFCGTPVITSDWGAFPETILHGKTGYRCRTFEEFCWAVRNIHRIEPMDCREWAEKNYSLERVGRMFEEYFQRLHRLFDRGWYQPNEERKELEWLNRYYPGY